MRVLLVAENTQFDSVLNTQIHRYEKNKKNPLKFECYPALFISEKKFHANYVPDEIWCYFASV